MNSIKELLAFLNINEDEVIPVKGEDGKYYYTYLIIPTNKNSQFYMNVYFGQKTMRSLNKDHYTGSGRKITRYIEKYPNDYYKKYLGFYNNLKELCKAEYELIHPHLNKEYCMNLKEGGGNGPLSEETKQIIRERLTGKPLNRDPWNKGLKNCFSEETRKRISESHKGEKNNMYGKNSEDYMTPDAVAEKRRKQSESIKGDKNGMWGIHVEDIMTPEAVAEKRRKQSLHMGGRKYMHKGQDLIYIRPEEIEKYKAQGYVLGRKR